MKTEGVEKSGYKVATDSCCGGFVTEQAGSGRGQLDESKQREEKAVKPRFAKLDQRYWKPRLFRRTDVGGGGGAETYSIRIQYRGKRHQFDTGSSEKGEAARVSVELFRSVVEHGWQKTIRDHAARIGRLGNVLKEPKLDEKATVGGLIKAFNALSTTRESSRVAYIRSLRKVYADINHIPFVRRTNGKHDGGEGWRIRVDALPIASVTPEKVARWKQETLAKTKGETERGRRLVTLNTLIRNCRAIFARRLRPLMAGMVKWPEQMPFEGVPMEKAPSTRYRSRTDARLILRKASEELKASKPEVYKIICLALRCGLRRAEIDSLLWKSVNLERKVIHVESNEYYSLKSADSHGEIDLGDDFVRELKAMKKSARSEFVVESEGTPRPHTGSGSYRCDLKFAETVIWLRKKGVTADRPLHELRKEVGSLIAREHGIFAASRFLRHSDIRITSQVYVDKKQRILPSFGG